MNDKNMSFINETRRGCSEEQISREIMKAPAPRVLGDIMNKLILMCTIKN